MENSPFIEDFVYTLLHVVHDHEDISSVKTLSLVCHEWRMISVPFIFRQVNVSNGLSLDRLASFLSETPAIIPLIRILVVHPRGDNPLMQPSAWVSQVPSGLSSLTENLEQIKFVGLFEYGSYMGRSYATKLSKFTSVHTLALQNCWVDLAVMQSLISALPSLCRFSANHILLYPPGPHQDVEILHIGNPRLVSVSISFTFAYADSLGILLQWLAASDSRETMRSFMSSVRPDDGEAMRKFLLEVGPCLEELRLHIDLDPSSDTNEKSFCEFVHLHTK